MEFLTNVTCPKCGGKIVITEKTYQCEKAYPEKECSFTFWKDQVKFFGVKVGDKMMTDLLNGETVVLERTSQKGNKYKANYKLGVNDKGYYTFVFDSYVNDNDK